jgi:Asp/Glu/hydantoin racemase
MAHSIVHAEKEGYDAGVVGCTVAESALHAARSVVDIPVTAPTESAILFAHTMGFKFSIITLEDSQTASLEGIIMRSGFTARLASVKGMGLTSEQACQLHSNPKKLADALTKMSKRLIKEDGAEVIIPGCTILSTILTANNIFEVNGVPVIDGVATSIKMAEALVDLKRSCNYKVCRNGLYGREKGALLSAPLRY